MKGKHIMSHTTESPDLEQAVTERATIALEDYRRTRRPHPPLPPTSPRPQTRAITDRERDLLQVMAQEIVRLEQRLEARMTIHEQRHHGGIS